MKYNQFILKIILVAIAVISLNFLTRIVINNFFWGNQDLYVKNYLFKQNHDFNNAFIGSSLTENQIIPEVFDSLINNKTLKSYNLGIGNTTPPETFYFSQYFIKNQPNLKTIIFELAPFHFNLKSTENISTNSYYYFNAKTQYIFQIDNYYQTKRFKNWRAALKNCKYSLIYSLYNLSNVDFFATIVNYYSKPGIDLLIEKNKKKTSNTGFFTLKPAEKDTSLVNNKRFEQKMNGYIHASKKQITDLNRSQKLYLNYIIQLNKLAIERNIKIYWMIPPCMNLESYSFILPVFNKINSPYKIDLADPKKYQQFYNNKIHFDLNHFNIDGAKQYTEAIANEFDAINQL
jgi:hypothetical protein